MLFLEAQRGVVLTASMKALPKRKGNSGCCLHDSGSLSASMKALPKRKGNVMSAAATARTVSGPQ